MQVTSGRRSQIVEAMIEVIASEGVRAASFARIREHAGLSSTRLISYHFDSRAELLGAALTRIIELASERMSPRIAAATTSRGRLEAYIRSNIEFLAERPDYAVAAVEILSAIGTPADEDAAADTAEQLLTRLFADGQLAGEMRTLDAALYASAVRAAIDRAVTRFARTPGLDLHRCADELVELFDRAVRPE
ncbi:TetR family transcriptional regulator [Galbitalea sp. SE-J8]|uniref:TetR/AcrR family transcriptional regulator n=1 Tax=Galbitalea sp. SE-J8 TaxID=3054952 RepID=UPI00259CAD3A|nr:TetR family transcriptional regulator [Galbitalea sp. SE-J8]MDM4763684.1 TetR family transcriptional regulator [Galbitalea sp. SE-J8]